jgi:hypothetical protein
MLMEGTQLSMLALQGFAACFARLGDAGRASLNMAVRHVVG